MSNYVQSTSGADGEFPASKNVDQSQAGGLPIRGYSPSSAVTPKSPTRVYIPRSTLGAASHSGAIVPPLLEGPDEAPSQVPNTPISRRTNNTLKRLSLGGNLNSPARSAAGMSRQVELPPTLLGRTVSRLDPRKYRYAAADVAPQDVIFRASKDDRMTVEEASEALERVRTAAGLQRGVHPDTVYAGFDHALWFCHTINGASRMNPGRSTFCVPGVTMEFNYLDVLNQLGVDARRFFRAYADDIAVANRRVIASYDPFDPLSQEQWGWLMDVAMKRGLTRFPYLAHDSADACLRLNLTERAALAASKVGVLSRVVNVADNIHSNSRVQTLPTPEDG